MADKLTGATEIAVDLEHHSFRTFQGLTCLMQLSDRNEDYIVDVLKLRTLIGPVLAPIFADPQASHSGETPGNAARWQLFSSKSYVIASVSFEKGMLKVYKPGLHQGQLKGVSEKGRINGISSPCLYWRAMPFKCPASCNFPLDVAHHIVGQNIGGQGHGLYEQTCSGNDKFDCCRL